jgi:hypothetical protein
MMITVSHWIFALFGGWTLVNAIAMALSPNLWRGFPGWLRIWVGLPSEVPGGERFESDRRYIRAVGIVLLIVTAAVVWKVFTAWNSSEPLGYGNRHIAMIL